MKNQDFIQYLRILAVFAGISVFASCAEMVIDTQNSQEPKLETDADAVYRVDATSPEAVVFNIASNVPWRITVDCGDMKKWCSASPSLSAVSSLTEEITVEIDDNTSREERTATLTVTAEGLEAVTEITIIQSPVGDLSVSALSSDDPVSESGGEVTFSVTSGKPWTASSNATWLTLEPSSGDGNFTSQTVTATAESNEGGTPRSATVTVSLTDGSDSKTITVNQAGSSTVDLKFTESAGNTVLSYKGEVRTLTIQAPAGVNLGQVDWSVNIPDNNVGASVGNYNRSAGTFDLTVPSSIYGGSSPVKLQLIAFEEVADEITIYQQSWLGGVGSTGSYTDNNDGTLTVSAGSGTTSFVRIREAVGMFGTYRLTFSRMDISEGRFAMEGWKDEQFQIHVASSSAAEGNSQIYMHGSGLQWATIRYNNIVAINDVETIQFEVFRVDSNRIGVKLSINGTEVVSNENLWTSQTMPAQEWDFGIRPLAGESAISGSLTISRFEFVPSQN